MLWFISTWLVCSCDSIISFFLHAPPPPSVQPLVQRSLLFLSLSLAQCFSVFIRMPSNIITFGCTFFFSVTMLFQQVYICNQSNKYNWRFYWEYCEYFWCWTEQWVCVCMCFSSFPVHHSHHFIFTFSPSTLTLFPRLLLFASFAFWCMVYAPCFFLPSYFDPQKKLLHFVQIFLFVFFTNCISHFLYHSRNGIIGVVVIGFDVAFISTKHAYNIRANLSVCICCMHVAWIFNLRIGIFLLRITVQVQKKSVRQLLEIDFFPRSPLYTYSLSFTLLLLLFGFLLCCSWRLIKNYIVIIITIIIISRYENTLAMLFFH